MPRRAAPLAAALLLAPSVASADEPFTLRPLLVAQLRLSGSVAVEGEVAPTLVELRRLRAGLRFAALDGRLTGVFVMNATPSALELIDLFAEYRVSDRVRVRAGAAKQPFTAYRLGSFADLTFVDWALVTRAFGGERQLGVELHDRGAASAFEYSLGLWNGTTMRAAHGRGPADAYGEAVTNLSDLRSYTAPDEPHPELTARAAWHRRGTLGFDLGLSALVDFNPLPARDFRAALAPEAALSAGPLRVELTGYLGLSENVQSSGVGLTWGALGEARVTVAQRVTFGLRYAVVGRDPSLRADARARADALIAAAAMDQRAALTRRYAQAGAVVAEHELAGAVALRIPGVPMSVQADAAWLRTERAAGELAEVRLRAQAQLAFQ